jgi:hypothetical protein
MDNRQTDAEADHSAPPLPHVFVNNLINLDEMHVGHPVTTTSTTAMVDPARTLCEEREGEDEEEKTKNKIRAKDEQDMLDRMTLKFLVKGTFANSEELSTKELRERRLTTEQNLCFNIYNTNDQGNEQMYDMMDNLYDNFNRTGVLVYEEDDLNLSEEDLLDMCIMLRYHYHNYYLFGNLPDARKNYMILKEERLTLKINRLMDSINEEFYSVTSDLIFEKGAHTIEYLEADSLKFDTIFGVETEDEKKILEEKELDSYECYKSSPPIEWDKSDDYCPTCSIKLPSVKDEDEHIESQSKNKNKNKYKSESEIRAKKSPMIFGAEIRGEFVSRSFLKSFKGVHGGETPLYVIKKGVKVKMTERLYEYLKKVDSRWLKLIIENIDEANKWRQPEIIKSQAKSDTRKNVSWLDKNFWALSYAAVTLLTDNQSMKAWGVDRNLLLDAVALGQSVFDINMSTKTLVMQMDVFRRRWQKEYFGTDELMKMMSFLGDSKTDLRCLDQFNDDEPEIICAQSMFNKLHHSLVEGVVVTILCSIMGLTSSITDFKSITVFLRESVVTGCKNIVDVIIAVITVISSGDFSDFFNKVYNLTSDDASKELEKLSLEYRELLARKPVVEDHYINSMKMYTIVSKLKKLATISEASGKMTVAMKCNVFALEVIANADLFNRMSSSGCVSKESLLFMNTSKSRTGKSIGVLCMANGLARVLKVKPEDSESLIYNYPIGSKFMEGYSHHHAGMQIDEFLSVVPEFDQTVGILANFLLTAVSPVPVTIPQAFESDKGKHTTKNLLMINVNTNSGWLERSMVFAGNAENLNNRAYMVKFVPKGKATNKFGVLTFDNFTEEDWTDDDLTMADCMDVIVRKRNDAGQWAVVYNGDVLGYCDFLYAKLYDKLYGRGKKSFDWVGKQILTHNNAIVFDTAQKDADLKFKKLQHKFPEFTMRGIPKQAPVASDSEIIKKGEKEYTDKPQTSIWGFKKGGAYKASDEENDEFALFVQAKNKERLQSQSFNLFSILILGGLPFMYRFRSYFYVDPRTLTSTYLLYENMFKNFMFNYGVTKVTDQIKDSIALTADNIMELLKQAYRRIQEFKEYYVPVLVGITAAISLGSYMMSGEEKEKESIVSQGFRMPISVAPDSFKDVPMEYKQFIDKLVPVLPMKNGPADLHQVYPSSNGMNIDAINMIRHNTVVVKVYLEDVLYAQVYGYRFFDVILVVNHAFPKILIGCHAVFYNIQTPNSIVPFILEDKYLMRFKDLDLAAIANVFPTSTRVVSNCIKQESRVELGDRVMCISPMYSQDLMGTIIKMPEEVTYNDQAGAVKIRGYRVQWDDEKHSEDGHCTRIVVKKNGGSHSFIGFLVAGITRGDPEIPVGISIVSDINFEDLRKRCLEYPKIVSQALMRSDLSITSKLEMEDILLQPPTSGLFSYPDIVKSWEYPYGVIGREQAQVPPSKSRLVKSPFFNDGNDMLEYWSPEVKYFPAVVSNTVRFDEKMNMNRHVSPFEVNLCRSDPTKYKLKLSVLHDFSSGLTSFFKDALVNFESKVKIKTIDEMLMRMPGLPPVNIATAAGETEPGKKGAFILESFRDGETKRFLDLRARTALTNLLIISAQGGIGCLVTSIVPKDELRTLEKVISVKTRLFYSVRATNYYATRLMIGQQIALVNTTLKYLGIMVGINASSKDWNVVFKDTLCTEPGDELLETDISGLDIHYIYSLHAIILSVLTEISLFLLSEEDKRTCACIISSLMWADLQHQCSVDGAYICGYFGGISGHFLTTVVNSLCNLFYWFNVFNRKFKMTFKQFYDGPLKHIKLYGDDTRIMKQALYSSLTVSDIVAEFANFGQILTSSAGQKSQLLASGTSKTFLKRGFRVTTIGGVEAVLCPLEFNSLIKSTLYYMPSGELKVDNERHFNVLRMLWDEAFFHDSDVKKVLRDFVMRCLKKLPLEYSERKMNTDEILELRWIQGDLKVWEL